MVCMTSKWWCFFLLYAGKKFGVTDFVNAGDCGNKSVSQVVLIYTSNSLGHVNCITWWLNLIILRNLLCIYALLYYVPFGFELIHQERLVQSLGLPAQGGWWWIMILIPILSKFFWWPGDQWDDWWRCWLLFWMCWISIPGTWSICLLSKGLSLFLPSM